MKIAISQPTFFPWLGYFQLIDVVDVFVFLDDVQFDKRSWQQRNRISVNGNFSWLTAPTKTSGLYTQKILDVRFIEDVNWRKKHLATINHNYSKSIYFREVMPVIQDIYNQDTESLAEFNIFALKAVCSFLQIKSCFLRSSNMEIRAKKSEKILSICKNLDATEYFAGASSRNYLDHTKFQKHGISLQYQKFRRPSQSNPEFNPSIIDYLFSTSKKEIRDMLKIQEPTK